MQIVKPAGAFAKLIEQARGTHVVVDRDEAVGTFGMTRTHFVLQAIGVCDV